MFPILCELPADERGNKREQTGNWELSIAVFFNKNFGPKDRRSRVLYVILDMRGAR